MRISLTNKDCKEQADAADLRKNMKTFNFAIFASSYGSAFKPLPVMLLENCRKLFLSLCSVCLLSAAHGELQHLRSSWENIPLSANVMSAVLGINSEFTDKGQRRFSFFHDEFPAD